MVDDLCALARATYQAYVDKDRAAIEAIIAADFHFTSPLDNRIDRATYFARCWPNSATISDFRFIHIVTYEGSGGAGRRFRNTEVLTFRGRQLIEAEVYFGWSLPHAAQAGAFVDPA